MSKIWVRFWKKSGVNMNLDETWRLHSDEDDEEDIKYEVENWSETVGGGFSRGYKYGFEINKPPTNNWINKKIKRMQDSIESLKDEIKQLEKYKK